MTIITNFDRSLQSLSNKEKETFFYLKSYGKRFANNITISLTHLAERIRRNARTVQRILKKLREHGLIGRSQRRRGEAWLTLITDKGWALLNYVASRSRAKKTNFSKNVVPEDAAKMSSQMSSQNPIYLRSISLKGSKIPLPTTPRAEGTNPRALKTNPRAIGTNPRAIRAQETVVDIKQVEVPKRLGEGFFASAKKVLGKINCTLREKVIREFDAYAAKTEVRHPIAFLKYKITQLSDKAANGPKVAPKIATERLQNEIKATALEMAKNELKRIGEGYPVQDASKTTIQFFDEIQAYGVRESGLYRFYERKLENEIKQTKSNC